MSVLSDAKAPGLVTLLHHLLVIRWATAVEGRIYHVEWWNLQWSSFDPMSQQSMRVWITIRLLEAQPHHSALAKLADPPRHPWRAYLLSLGHVGVALGTDWAGRLGGLERRAVHLQPPQITAPEAALIHYSRLGRPPTARAVPRGLVCSDQTEGLALEWDSTLCSRRRPAPEHSSPHARSTYTFTS